MSKRPDPGTPFEAQAVSPIEPTTAPRQMAKSIVRLGTGLRLLVLVVPLSAVGTAVWSFWQSYIPASAAAARYAAAPQCDRTTQAQDCYALERGQLVSLSWSLMRFGAYTDTLVVSLPDGMRTADVSFDIFGPKNVHYASSDGQVKVKIYHGQITEVFAADGTSYETSGSPVTTPYRLTGYQVIVMVIFVPWLLIMLYALVRHPRAVKVAWTGITAGRLVDS